MKKIIAIMMFAACIAACGEAGTGELTPNEGPQNKTVPDPTNSQQPPPTMPDSMNNPMLDSLN